MASACVKTIGVQPENFIDCPPATFPAFGWLNPRISFSREYSDEKKPSVTLEASDPAKDAADFEFRLDDSVTMLPADELFSDGKLMPLQLTATRSAPSTSTDPPVSSETTKSLRASEALFSPKAPRCSSRWREILGLKKLYQNNNNNKTNSSSNVATPSNSSSNTGKSIRQFLLRNTKSLPESNTDASLNLPLLKESKDSDSESISVSSSRLSLSSSSSGHDFDDLPRISLDSDSKNNNIQPHTSLSRCSSGSNHVPGHPRVRMVKPRMAPASVAENPKPLIDHPSAPTPITRTISVDSPRMSSSGKIVFQGLERSSSSPSSFNGGPKYNKNRGMESIPSTVFSMDSLLWFRETIVEVDDKSHGQKLVPWLSWDEWELVRTSLFSNSPESIAFALDRIAAWRSRGCLPVTVEVTASIIKIQQKDPVFRAGSSSDASDDEEILAMLYSMAVMRLVNGLIEKTRRRSEVSIAEAAAKIDMPRMLIDIRHEASHRELPSLHLLRQASTEALNWLKSFYWDSQKKAIPFRGGKNSSVREEISSKLHQLVLDLKKKQSLRLHSSDIKEKRSRKQVTRTLKSLVNLYAFFSSEVTSLLLEFLLGVPEPLNMVEFPAKFQDALSLDVAQTAFDKWKPVITKFSKKEPELLLSLLNAVVDMIEGRRAMRDDLGQKHFSLSVYDAETCQIGVLSSLFSWLVEILKALRSLYPDDSESITDKNASVLPKSILLELLHRCLLISESGNNALFSSALLLAELVGNSHLNHKPNKLSLLCSLPYLDFSKDNDCSAVDPEKLVYREKDFQQASEKVELLKRRRLNCSSSQATSSSTGSTSKWTVVGSWKPCPIGMLPRALGTSGCLPVLDCKNEQKETVASMSRKEEKETLSSIDNERLIEVSNMGNNENQEAGNGSGKRKTSCEVDEVSNPLPKRFQGAAAHNDDKNAANVDDNKEDTWMDWSEGRLFINGVFKKVEEEELKRIQSRIRILVRIPGHLNTDRKLVTQNP